MKLWTIYSSGVVVRAGATMRSSSHVAASCSSHIAGRKATSPAEDSIRISRHPPAEAQLRIQITGMCAPTPDALRCPLGSRVVKDSLWCCREASAHRSNAAALRCCQPFRDLTRNLIG